MRILVVGAGAREHALVGALAARGHDVLAAPGNPGMERWARCLPVGVLDVAAVVAAAVRENVHLVVVGPEAPLVAGLADACRAAGILCFGPGQDGARLEGSKAFSKEFFARHKIPTAAFRVVHSVEQADAAIDALGARVVVKADGLAAGKGVMVCSDAAEARRAARDMLEGDKFGEAGRTLVIEQRIDGREVSVLALCDGRTVRVLPAAEDHKAVFDGDKGPNTGGMGVVAPSAVLSPELLARVESEILAPTVSGLRAENIDYRGVLFAGLMIDASGAPWLLEYNCRFGDPEAQALFVLWDDDPADWLAAAAQGAFPPAAPRFGAGVAVCVILAAAGYPAAPRSGDVITGLASWEHARPPGERSQLAVQGDVHVFHAGTRRDGDRVVTAGGRVLAVTARGDSLAHARELAYAACDAIAFDGAHFRRDIGLRS